MKRNISKYRAAIHSSAANYDNTAHLITSCSSQPWLSAGKNEEWVYVDLGAQSEIENVVVHWGGDYALSYQIQLSDDAENWAAIAECTGAPESAVETPVKGFARYLKVLCQKCSGERYSVYRLEVFGENNLCYSLPPIPAPAEDGTQLLTGGNWRISRAEETCENGTVLSRHGFDDSEWLPATVPGTALVSYLNGGAIPDPNYDDRQFQISEAYFTSDFWYRNHFPIPKERHGQRVYLNFDSINWKADVYFNGNLLKNEHPNRKNSIEGAFIRGKFDVTEFVSFGEENYLAVYIYKNDNPGKVTTQGLAFGPGRNGGLLGADNPTLHASVGWDWLPTIRGRNIGIYGDVYISYSKDAELVDPWMQTNLCLKKEESAIPAENLLLRKNVHINGGFGFLDDWRGKEGDGFTVDFGEPVTLGSVTLVWGNETGGAAADADSRHPELFALECSSDGNLWANIDAHPGGEMTWRWWHVNAAPNIGSGSFEGHTGADSVQGSTAILDIDMSRFGRGIDKRPVFDPQKIRYLRFTVLKRRELNGKPVDTRLHELIAYAESPQQVEQGRKHIYLLDTSCAELLFSAELRNRGSRPISAELKGKILPDNIPFEKAVEIASGETVRIEIPIQLDSPKLWWPNTYGEQFLYTAEAELLADGIVSDKKSFKFGVRRFDTPIDGGLLSLYCNGVRIVAKGGNWGMDDGLKRDTRQVLDDKVRLHAEANLTMIRNWVGMTNHPAFYDACDKYGILIWDDFWLANPGDGPEPTDTALFLENAADKIRRIRGHASLAFYCGRNEGYPNEAINAGLTELTESLDGSRIYFPHSAAAPVGSGGGYSLAAPGGNRGIKQYFNDVSSSVLRSERGIPNVPALESMKRFLKPENVWPINEVWALHDWTYHMNGPASTYMAALQSYLGGEFEIPVDRVQGSEPRSDDPVYLKYKADIAKMCDEAGKAWTAEEFSKAAQLINYDNHRGMFEALGSRYSNGLLMWMSQSSWPSFMWQTYDYYLDTNGGYFGTKAGNQPTRAIFDPRDDSIVLANASSRLYENVCTTAKIFDLYGKLVSSEEYVTERLEPDSFGITLGKVDFSAAKTDIVFLQLTLRQTSGSVLGENTYWHNRIEYQNYRALSVMEKASVSLKVLAAEHNASGEMKYTLQIQNGSVPALGVRLRLIGEGDSPILPVFYSDNYLTMMPEEKRIISASVARERLRGEPMWELSGWNVENAK